MLSVSFQIGEMRREFGGCAGNIAYNLSALGGEPVVMATLGADGTPYRERFRQPRDRPGGRQDAAADVHRASIHHHRPRRQSDHRVPSGRDERVAREPRRRRRGHRARHRRARRPGGHAFACRAVCAGEDSLRVRSWTGIAALLRAGVDRDDRRGVVRGGKRLRGAAPRRTHGLVARRDRGARRCADRDDGWRRRADPYGRRHAGDSGGAGGSGRRSDGLRRCLPRRTCCTGSSRAGAGSAPAVSRPRWARSRSHRAAARITSISRDRVATAYYEAFHAHLW